MASICLGSAVQHRLLTPAPLVGEMVVVGQQLCAIDERAALRADSRASDR